MSYGDPVPGGMIEWKPKEDLAQVCPVCGGTGEVEEGFYKDNSTKCRACYGRGVFERPAPVAPYIPWYQPQPYYLKPYYDDWWKYGYPPGTILCTNGLGQTSVEYMG